MEEASLIAGTVPIKGTSNFERKTDKAVTDIVLQAKTITLGENLEIIFSQSSVTQVQISSVDFSP